MNTTTVADMPSTIRYSITERRLNGDHGPIRYWESSPHQGEPVLLIHGYGALIEHWRPVMRPIARMHTLYAMDLYGFGYSARPRVGPTKELWAKQAADLIGSVMPGPAVVVGHSMGGMVASELARAYPQLVRGLVLVNSAGLPPTRSPSAFDRAFFNMLRMDGVGEMLAGVFTNPWGVRQGLLSSYYKKERVTPELVATFSAPLRQPGAAQYYLATTRSFADFFLDIKPGEVQAPTLLLWGEEDRSLPPSVATNFKQRMFPEAEITLIPESGHCPFDETPEAFCDVLLPWINRLA